ncbi:hypothetical protein [Flavobacterium chungbukense]|uniref:DUF4348 domain-containing protein n=1 Tax=Flavobacterium chungbukense TaxID=877464 RepID=A0ABP7YJX1_9FLAO|nr:hypothetical protein [Flavobacterium chungbukense]MCC4920041.1 hypothetical protein [Flavobacterium chungbukense]
MKSCKTFTLAAFCIFFLSCNKNKVEESNLDSQTKNSFESKKTETAENFEEFNKKFHSDSIFQVSRVDFPIEGKHVSGFEQYNWTRKNWEFLAIPVAEKTEIGEYEHSLIKTDSLIIERFWIPDSGFEVERQFKLINNKWFLISYNDINL